MVDILKNIPEEFHQDFTDALKNQGFAYATDPKFEAKFGDPVLAFKLGYICCLDSIYSNKLKLRER